MSHRLSKTVRKIPKREKENRIITSSKLSSRIPILQDDDYQAPLTAQSLSPKSKWIFVRENLHRIRSYGVMRRMSIIDPPYRDWYLFFQMKRELKRAEEQIRAVQYQTDFKPVQHFDLYVDETHYERFNVSHVQPNDGIFYAGLSAEPLVLEYLLYYFSKQNRATHDSLFHAFLSDVNSVLYTNRQRIQRVVVFKRVALVIALAMFVIIIIMFFSLILSVLTTTSNIAAMYRDDLDGGIDWRSSNALLVEGLSEEQY